jgi:hypothetical protein
MAQIEVNKAEAASGVAVQGRVEASCRMGLRDGPFYHFILQPVLLFGVAVAGVAIPALPEFDMASLMPILLGCLAWGACAL